MSFADWIRGKAAWGLSGHAADHGAMGGALLNNSAKIDGKIRIAVGANVSGLHHPDLPVLSAAYDAMLAGSGDVIINFVGDSTTRGAYANGSAFAANRKYAYPDIMAGLLAERGIATSTSSFFGDAGMGNTNLESYDDRMTRGVWAAKVNRHVPGGVCMSCSGSVSPVFAFAPGEDWDRVDIYTAAYPTSLYGTYSVLIDDAIPASGAVAKNTNAAHAVQKTTVSAASMGKHTLKIVGPAESNEIHLLGFEFYCSARRRVRLRNLGYCGSRTDVWAQVLAESGGPYAWSPKNAMSVLGGHLTVVNLGINDLTASVTVATYKSQLKTFVAAEKTRGADVIVTSMSPTGQANFGTTGLQYVTAAQEVAAETGSLFLDYAARWGGYAGALAAGYLAADGIHNTSLGYADRAMAEAGVIGTYFV